MNEKALAARRAYKREWQRNNPDKTKQYQERYWNKKAAEAAGEPANNPKADNATA